MGIDAHDALMHNSVHDRGEHISIKFVFILPYVHHMQLAIMNMRLTVSGSRIDTFCQHLKWISRQAHGFEHGTNS